MVEKEQKMEKAYIFETFKKLSTAAEKVEYLEQLRTLNLTFDFNYEGLIKAWKRRIVVDEA